MNFWLERRKKAITIAVFELGGTPFQSEKVYAFERPYPDGEDRKAIWTANYNARLAGYDIIGSDGAILASQIFNSPLIVAPGTDVIIIFPKQIFV